jgi:hypothetical protein
LAAIERPIHFLQWASLLREQNGYANNLET